MATKSLRKLIADYDFPEEGKKKKKRARTLHKQLIEEGVVKKGWPKGAVTPGQETRARLIERRRREKEELKRLLR